MRGIGDITMGVTEYALDGLARRAEVRANNVANVNTPGFRAARVDFESTLATAISRGDVASVGGPSITPDPSLPNPETNNTVSLENEMTGMLKDNLLRDAMVNAFNFKANLLRGAIGGHS